MAFPQQTHPDDLRDAVGQAIIQGKSAPQVCRELEAGTFQDFGPYTLTPPTARWFAQRVRKTEAAQGLTPRAHGDLDEAITGMAREILSELDQELTKVRQAKARDLEKLGTITKGLKDLRSLIVAGKGTNPAAKAPAKARDPFAAQLEEANKPKTTRATSPKKKEDISEDGPAATQQREGEETPNPTTNANQVLSPALPVGGWLDRSGVVA